MIRNALTSLPRACARVALAGALGLGAPSLVAAQTAAPAQKPAAGASAQRPAQKPAQKPQTRQPAAKPPAEAAEAGKPTLVATMGDWAVYATTGAGKQCYALSQPKDRPPKELKRDPAYLFISTRPSEKPAVRDEFSIIIGFDVKADGKTAPEAAIGPRKFALAAQGGHLWIKDKDDITAFSDALRKGSRLTVKASSLRGNVTTDSYSLTGIGGALDRVKKECS